jgi:hypothetical protein
MAPDFRFAAWRAQVDRRAMRVGPLLAIAGAFLMLFGLVKFWQGVAHRGSTDTASNGPESIQDQAMKAAQDMQKKLHIGDMKRELSDPEMRETPQTPAPTSYASSPLINYFPSNENYGQSGTNGMVPTFPSNRQAPQFRPQASAIIRDPWGDALHAYAMDLRASGRSVVPNDESGSNRIYNGPGWHDGLSMRR